MKLRKWTAMITTPGTTKVISLFLSLAMVLGIIFSADFGFKINAEAAVLTVLTENEFQAKLDDWKKDFREGEYWNRNSNGSTIFGTSTSHINCTHSGYCPDDRNHKCLCGVSNGRYQCYGYAFLLAETIFGDKENTGGWKTYETVSDLYAGDVVSYTVNLTNGGTSHHTIFITMVDGDKVTFSECNYEGPCMVSHKRQPLSKQWLINNINSNIGIYGEVDHYTGNTLRGTGTVSAGVNHGDDFFAFIRYSKGNLNVANINGNVQTASINENDPRQIWHFQRLNSSNTYKIVNMYDGRCLDVSNSVGPNVQVWDDLNNTAQQWSINYMYSSTDRHWLHKLSPACAKNKSLDIYNASTDVGANVQIYDSWQCEPQSFELLRLNDNINSWKSCLTTSAGGDFYARIKFKNMFLASSGTAYAVNDGNGTGYGVNVALSKKSEIDSRQIWHFIRQANGSYKIVNDVFGWCLDVRTGIAENKQQVWLWEEDHGGDPQRWYLMKVPNESTYRFVSALTFPYGVYSMDIPNGNAYEGAPVEIYWFGDKTCQKFDIEYIRTVSYNGNGGIVLGSPATKVSSGYPYGELADATRSGGYKFDGWYTAKTGGTKITPGTTFNSNYDQTLYAHWTPQTYTVSLDTNGGTINSGNVTGYTYGTGTALPTNVTKTDHAFDGWYDNSSLSGERKTSISASDTGNKTFFAKWIASNHTIVVTAPTFDNVVEGYTLPSAKPVVDNKCWKCQHRY